MRYHPILKAWRLHAGVDFAVRCGTPVRAAAAGRVIKAGRAGGYGNRVVISHGRQRRVVLTTTYNHLSRFAVRSGRVARGQVIAYAGTTGFSTGCHLHFETRQNGKPVNPRRWL
ncbi:MAG: M23 family metallopeptidase [Chloroflexota bacterium]